MTFAGYQPRPLDYMAASDIFVLPSLSEGMPLVVLEAMSMGLPVVSTRVGAVPDLIEDGRSGILVPPGDPDAIATAVERLGNAPLREKLGQEARQSVSPMGIESTTALLVSCYHRLVRKDSPG